MSALPQLVDDPWNAFSSKFNRDDDTVRAKMKEPIFERNPWARDPESGLGAFRWHWKVVRDRETRSR